MTGELLVSLAIELAVETKTSERNKIVALPILLGNVSRKTLKSVDFEPALNKYLEYSDDTRCDGPALQSSSLADIGFCGYLLYTFSKLFLDSICATMSYFSGFGTPLPKLIHFCSGS